MSHLERAISRAPDQSHSVQGALERLPGCPQVLQELLSLSRGACLANAQVGGEATVKTRLFIVIRKGRLQGCLECHEGGWGFWGEPERRVAARVGERADGREGQSHGSQPVSHGQ